MDLTQKLNQYEYKPYTEKQIQKSQSNNEFYEKTKQSAIRKIQHKESVDK